MLIWGTQVSALQAFGYAIALGGIVVYKLGLAAVRDLISDVGAYCSRRPLLRRAIILGVALAAFFALLTAFGGSASPLETLNRGSAGQAGM